MEMKLSPAQRKALQSIANDEGHIGYWRDGLFRWTTDVEHCTEERFRALLERGYLEFVPEKEIPVFYDRGGIRWYRITDAGREALKP
jgi:hypothetical protein